MEPKGHSCSKVVQAWLVAGARSVLASHWSLDDAAAARSLVAYCKRLIGRATPARSLAGIQRDAIAGRLGDDLRDPSHWAGYVLCGGG